jgi:prepilin-type N-terminal cleavage/methylation domain-containing protein
MIRTAQLPITNNPSRKVNHQGFTLLELILVMVILSTVLALAGPSLRGFFASRKTQDAAAQILALTQLSRSWAVSDGNPVRLNFDDKEGSYWLTVQQGGSYERLLTEFGRTFFLPQGVTLQLEDLEEDGDAVFIAFDPRSTITAGTIRLTDRRGYVVKIVCPAPTESFTIEVLNKDDSKRAS